MLILFKKINFICSNKTVWEMYKLFLLLLIMFFVSCETQKKSFYIKARNNKEVKIGAFEICGRNFNILTYEGDTALINCTKKNKDKIP